METLHQPMKPNEDGLFSPGPHKIETAPLNIPIIFFYTGGNIDADFYSFSCFVEDSSNKIIINYPIRDRNFDIFNNMSINSLLSRDSFYDQYQFFWYPFPNQTNKEFLSSDNNHLFFDKLLKKIEQSLEYSHIEILHKLFDLKYLYNNFHKNSFEYDLFFEVLIGIYFYYKNNQLIIRKMNVIKDIIFCKGEYYGNDNKIKGNNEFDELIKLLIHNYRNSKPR